MNPAIKDRPSPLRPAGADKGGLLTALGQGAHVLQDHDALKGFDVYNVGFHPAKDDPTMQMEAHHYCKVVNADLMQCVLFDGNTAHANLIGVEYIISERLFDTLPEEERDYWHPHNFEVLGGSLIAPGLPPAVEHQFMKLAMMNSYGKTWHTWHTGRHDGAGEPGTPLPFGDPKLMWSFNREGEADPALESARDAAMGLSTSEKKAERQDLVGDAHPQRGVDAIADHFTGTVPVPGVIDIQHLEGGSATHPADPR